MTAKPLYRAARVLCAALFTIIFVLCILSNLLSDILIAAGILLLFIAICALLRRCAEKRLTLLFVLLTVGFGVALYFFGMDIRVRPSWDFGRIYNGAADLIQNGRFETTWSYYLESVNNLFPTLWIAGFVRLFALFGPVNMLPALVALNAASIALAVLFLFFAAKTAVGTRTAFAAGLLCFISAPLYAYSPICYTDTLSMPLMTLCLLLCARGLDRQRGKKGALLFGAAAGAAAFVAYRLKPTAAFPLIAAAVVILLVRRDGLWFLAAAFATFALCMGGYQFWLSGSGLIDLSDLDAYRLPAMHYLRMGLIGNGGYNGESHAAAAALPDAAARTAQAREEIAALLREYGVGGLLSHLVEKIRYTWNDGLYYATPILAQDVYQYTDLHQIVLSDGKYFALWRGWAQGMQIVTLGCLAAGSISFAARRGRNDDAALMPVVWFTLFGVAAFLLIWETRARYLVNCIPLFALCTATILFAALDKAGAKLAAGKK